MDQKLPQHVAIVMDGNGRWAEKHGLPRIEGHRLGVDVVKTIVRHCLKKKIKVLSLFAFSRENWGRPADEVQFLMELFMAALQREIDDLHQQGVCLRFTGDRSQLDTTLCDMMASTEALTANNQLGTLNIVMNYGGQWDILQATKTLVRQVTEGSMALEQIDERAFAQCLSMHDLPDPDLLIRTSGEQRISDFFLWQLAFTEFYFSDVLWPEFTTTDFDRALVCFSKRERRYGKTSKQLTEGVYV